ncbi:DMT family transporter [Phanerochaete sordida]|uniref:DMT family transporter n=1 Tax=Phanerochaete sordida TaxID=48140 RepID=A0A9P3LDN1_9APHY|nr:DMT family transporter [Phanerochaete sordida]
MATARTPYEAQWTPDTPTFPPGVQDLRGARLGEVEAALGALGGDSESRSARLWRTFVQRAQEVVDENTGMLLVAASEVFYAAMSLAVKEMGEMDPPMSSLELIWIYMVVTWLCSVGYMYWAGIPDPLLGPKNVRALLAFRGFCGFIAYFGIYYSVQVLSIADATVLTFIAPILTTFTGAFFLGERFSWKQVAAGFASLIGVILIARPPFLFGDAPEVASSSSDAEVSPTDVPGITPAERLLAVGVALFGAVGAVGVYTAIRAVGTRAHSLHNINSVSLQCIIGSTLGMLIFKTKIVIPTSAAWIGLLFVLGITSFLAQVLMTMGLRSHAVGRTTMAVYIEIVYAIVFDAVFFHTAPSVLSIVGTVIIVVSAIYVALCKGEKASEKIMSSEDSSLQEGLLASLDKDMEEVSPRV